MQRRWILAQIAKQHCNLDQLRSDRAEHLNAVYCSRLFMIHKSRKDVAFQYPFNGGCAGSPSRAPFYRYCPWGLLTTLTNQI